MQSIEYDVENIVAVESKKKLDTDKLTKAMLSAQQALLTEQQQDGHWCFDLEADCTIPAEYILMMHFMDEIDSTIQCKLANYIRNKQASHGGWPLYYGGEFDISCSVKAYYALKLAGDDPKSPHMQTAHQAILEHGGAAKANVFTHITLAFFKQVPWRGVPFLRAEMIFFPTWFPFHFSKVSYWSRAVMIPLLILYSMKAEAKNPQQIDIAELFLIPPEQETEYFSKRSFLNRFFLLLEQSVKKFERVFPEFLKIKAIKHCEQWCLERLNGEHGLGAIFPAMVNVFQAFSCIGYDKEHPLMQTMRKALARLLKAKNEEESYCQPCLSPVWDTALSAIALQEMSHGKNTLAIEKACEWLIDKQLNEHPGDWQFKKPKLQGGGWAFQYQNDHYPDLDDTALTAWLLIHNNHNHRFQKNIDRALNWLVGMQSRNGGFASFEVNNTHDYLNHVPFADHGALLDPPSVDVTARCLMALGCQPVGSRFKKHIRKALQYIAKEQEDDGSWFGRWGTNYIYGTWSVLSALEAIAYDMHSPMVQKAANWIVSRQHDDGGWGENNSSYYANRKREPAPSNAFQTAWAILALISAGLVNSNSVRKGIAFLISAQQENGFWEEPWFNAPGFPRVFYLKYHGYSNYFSLWALAKYANTRHV